jgi:integrase
MLQDLTPESEFFFWSGKGNPASRVDTFRDRMKKLFVAAGIRVFRKTARKKSGGKLKPHAEMFWESSAFPHMWRHTLVRDLYVRDVPVRQIADILGDEPATVTKHYSQFDRLRHRKAMATLGDLYRFDPVFQRRASPNAPTGARHRPGDF